MDWKIIVALFESIEDVDVGVVGMWSALQNGAFIKGTQARSYDSMYFCLGYGQTCNCTFLVYLWIIRLQTPKRQVRRCTMSRKPPQKPAQKGQDEDREDKLQAVVGSLFRSSIYLADRIQVLADSFETRFNPFTLERPRVRITLCNQWWPALTCEVSLTPCKYTSNRVYVWVSCKCWGWGGLYLLWCSYWSS